MKYGFQISSINKTVDISIKIYYNNIHSERHCSEIPPDGIRKGLKRMSMLALVAPVLGIVALLFARSLSVKVSKQDAGTDSMKEIAAFIHEGAQAFLFAEYKILVVFVAVLFVGVGLGIGWITAVAFLLGALFSTVAGYCGMNVATKANVRTAAAAKDSGMNKALSIAFSGGAVMGM